MTVVSAGLSGPRLRVEIEVVAGHEATKQVPRVVRLHVCEVAAVIDPIVAHAVERPRVACLPIDERLANVWIERQAGQINRDEPLESVRQLALLASTKPNSELGL